MGVIYHCNCEENQALFYDDGLVRCQYCGGLVSKDRAHKFLQENRVDCNCEACVMSRRNFDKVLSKRKNKESWRL
jgi:hypothetical protein